MSRLPLGPLVKFLIFSVITAILTVVLGVTIANGRGGDVTDYSARFSDATGLLPGDDIRIAGVVVGTVKSIEVVDRKVAQVDFSVDSGQQLPATVNATIKYRNLIGQRYVSLDQGAGPTGELLPAGGQIPLERTRPALNLTVLFNGFQPLFQGLDPQQINQLSLNIVQTLQGEGGTVQSLLASTASLTNSIADRDRVIGQVIDNLNAVLDTVNRNDQGLNELISSLQALVSGLAQDRQPIGQALESIGTLTQVTGDFVQQARPPLKDDIKNLGDLSTQLDQGRPAVEHFLQLAPYKLNKIARVGSYGSWFQFYVCQLSATVDVSEVPGFPNFPQLPGFPLDLNLPKDDAPRCGADPDQDGLSVANGDIPGRTGGDQPHPDNRAAGPAAQEPTTQSLDALTSGGGAPPTDSSSNPAAPLLPALPAPTPGGN
ncbi:phospholipid/cholesterol/gamma-HCH transport system substrate-binding protein [Pseudonocardia endophytica]|uniref:Phospholipid/cholesterol/gamma-HCH transport system substrate-binding protein n=1 Tax=Pseudonocardia endophytica TaxID=401976 RepID=A0A4V2PHD4_PSEEN|nr:MCE family protein [Pseudonocardia endophytica]TCK20306.1 phospholipid/cholesterol/gamma-HCH transport system substrate-binding protein [Pseudonocardia endophytica]